MRVDMVVEITGCGAMFIMAGGKRYFVGDNGARDFLGSVMRDVVSE